MKLSARKLREERKQRIAARKKAKAKKKIRADGLPIADGEEEGGGEEDVPDWLEDKIDEDGDGEEFEEGAEGDDDTFPADLPEEPEMPGDLEEGEGEDELDDLPPDEEEELPEEMPELASVKAAWGYNPVYQKPTKLGTHTPRGYHYFGPLPDAGTSYGYFIDAASKAGVIAPMPVKGKSVFSPITGKPMKFAGKVGTDAIATVMAVASDMSELNVGGEQRFTTAPLDKVADHPNAFDPMTGEEFPVKADDEGEEMPPVDDGVPLDEEDIEDEGAEEMEGIEYEALQSLDEIEKESIAEDDVHMTLFDEGTEEAPGENPYWNVDIGGEPVARIYLRDQPKPAEIRKVFCGSQYYQGVSGAISKVGLKPVLKQLKAHIFANRVQKTQLAKDIKARVDAEAKRRVDATTKNLVKSLLKCTAIVCAGMDKNVFKDVGNPLKEALWAECHKMGIANPSPLIEAAFRKGSTQYFETVLSKAVEYMEMEPVALEQIQDAIGDMDVMPPADENVGDEIPEVTPDPDEAATLSERLAASSVAVAGMSAVAGNPRGDHKAALRKELRLGGVGPVNRR